MVGARNAHTTGTEFYGHSSNFALLNQLFSRARRLSGNNSSTSARFTSSIVDILYDEQSNLPDPLPSTPVTAAGRSSQYKAGQKETPVTTPTQSVSEANPDIWVSYRRQFDSWDCFIGSPMRLEMGYISLYFENIHTTQPFLSKEAFITRCEQNVWAHSSLKRLRRDQMHFLSLYNAVLAVAALTAGPDKLQALRDELENNRTDITAERPQRPTPSSMLLSKLYFWRARHLLGDAFEVCSIDSAQALLLLSIYCQHALRPHPCYMYSGMAVRTALAIGISSDSSLPQKVCPIAASRTWWAIYVQDIEASCWSGRPSTLANPSDYSIPLCHHFGDSEANGYQDLYISALVESSCILQQMSRKLYHGSRNTSATEKSAIALNLDASLATWGSRLPGQINPGVDSFDETESVTKQKLNLQLRFYHIKILIHRPLFSDSASNDDGVGFNEHMRICLNAAQKTINLLYDAYQHRNYFRTWWYNTIYILYASLIILYAILLDYADSPVDQLIYHVQKALKILSAMKEMKVSQRCAGLIDEILQVAKGYSLKENDRNLHLLASGPSDSNGEATVPNHPSDSHGEYIATSLDQNQIWEETLSFDQLHSLPEAHQSARNDILAYLGDPGILESFAIDANGGHDYVMSTDEVAMGHIFGMH
jgi:hypothetical protein